MQEKIQKLWDAASENKFFVFARNGTCAIFVAVASPGCSALDGMYGHSRADTSFDAAINQGVTNSVSSGNCKIKNRVLLCDNDYSSEVTVKDYGWWQ